MKELLARLRAGWGNLADRERLLVSVAGGSLVLALLWFLVITPALARRSQVQLDLSTAEQQLQLMGRLRAEYDEVQSRLSGVEERIRNGRRGNLRTTLENLASRVGVPIESMEPQASPSNEKYRETKVEVGLKGVTLPQTVRYLQQIETSNQVLSVKTLRIRTRSGKENLLDVTFTVSSFEPI